MPDLPLFPAELAWPFALAIAWIAGEFGHRWTGLPRISIYGLVGFLLANIWASLLPGSLSITLLANIAFGLILFELGYRINLRWLRNNPWLGVTSLAEAIATFAAVFYVAQAFAMPFIPSLLLASLCMATSPAAVLQLFYLNRLQGELIDTTPDEVHIKRGGIGMIFFGIAAISAAVVMNIVLHIDIEYAIGMGLSILGMYAWHLKRGGHNVMLLVQMQKVEWNTLLFFIGIISGVAALNHVGWLSYIPRLFEALPPTTVNMALDVISGVLDNVPVEAAALMSNPQPSPSQWALNALMVGIGGSLTVIGSAAGVMVMSIDKSYSFGTHLKFLPAILTNFFVSLGVWYVQFEILQWHA